MIAFVSGHLDITMEEFVEHYLPRLSEALKNKDSFVVGDARGTDEMTQEYLILHTNNIIVYHMFNSPRNCEVGLLTKGGYKSDAERDEAMTKASDYDIAWVRPGREKSGTAKNIKRRKSKHTKACEVFAPTADDLQEGYTPQ